MDLSKVNIFVTGGAGTLGRAIARRRKEEGWSGKLTVYSTDNHKHDFMRRLFPDVSFIQGDIRNGVTLLNGMVGHDIVIHAGAVKVIPDSEKDSIDTVDVNVYGSSNVCVAAIQANISHVLSISTDKACHPANAYGATKMLMEKIFQEFARTDSGTKFHLVRYGNVLESTGSVVEWWKKTVAMNKPIKITDPSMTRFWLSPRQAVEYVEQAFDFEAGLIFVPKMPALSVGKLAEYVVGGRTAMERIPLRPGEKMHETLVTVEETMRAEENDGSFVVYPSTVTGVIFPDAKKAYSSDIARELTETELAELLND
jgi:FlaA1/EpsC-like NDP-sugar epimerase